MDIRGIGTLVLGKGAGKSEAALALLERGHSLVADDMVRVKLLSDHTPVGFCDEMSRGFMECRGIGIINVEELFGIRFIRIEKKIELVVTFTENINDLSIDRTGLREKHLKYWEHRFLTWKYPCVLAETWLVWLKWRRWSRRPGNWVTIQLMILMNN